MTAGRILVTFGWKSCLRIYRGIIMKKNAFFLCVLGLSAMLLAGCATSRYQAAPHVTALFFGNDKQVYMTDSGETLLDSLWIYYSDKKYDQYVIYPDGKTDLFASGTYESFGGEEYGTKIFEKKGGSKHVLSVFIGDNRQPYDTGDGNKVLLDTVWVYYSDKTFDQYAILPDGQVVLFSCGLYKLADEKAVAVAPGKKFTLHRSKKYQKDGGLLPYSSTHDYEDELLDFTLVYLTPAAKRQK